MMDLAQFYQAQNRTSGFMDPNYGGPHWGQDFNSASRLPAGTSIPALSSGTVVRNGWQDGHGWYISHTAAEPGWYWTYSHRQSQGGPGVGERVAKNQSAGALGNTGLSTAPHVHVQYTQNPDPWKNGAGVAVDPWPKIVASLASWAGGGTEILVADEDEMQVKRIRRNGIGEFYLYVSPSQVSLSRELSTLSADDRAFEGRVAKALNNDVEPTFWDETPNGGWYMRNQLANKVAGMPSDYPLAPDRPYDPLTRVQGGSGSGASVEEIVAGVKTVVPTADENGAAARKAIVK